MNHFPHPDACALVVVDVQERLCPAMSDFQERFSMMQQAIRIADILKVRMVVTEQYPKGLGETVPEIAALLPDGCSVFSKTAFSCWGSADFAAHICAEPPKALILIGMETHVCVQQTALDARKRGLNVILLADAICSRREQDRAIALEYMRGQGIAVTSVEALAFDWLQDSAHPKFRDIAAIVR